MNLSEWLGGLASVWVIQCIWVRCWIWQSSSRNKWVLVWVNEFKWVFEWVSEYWSERMNVSEWMSGFDQVLRCPCEFLTCLSGNSPRCNQKPVYPIMRMSNHPYYIGIFTVTFCFRPCVRPMTPACSPLFPTSHGWPVCRVAPTAPRQPAPQTPIEDWINRG